MATALRRVQGRAPAHGAARHGARRRGLRRLRASSDGDCRDARRRPLGVSRIAASGRSSSRARRRRAGGCSRRISRAPSPRPIASILPAVFRSTLPEDQRLSAEQLVADLQAAARTPATSRASTTSSQTVAQRSADGRPRRRHVERRLRRHPSEAAGRARGARAARHDSRCGSDRGSVAAPATRRCSSSCRRHRRRASTRWCDRDRARRSTQRSAPRVRDVVVGYASVTVYFDPLLVDAGVARARAAATSRRPCPTSRAASGRDRRSAGAATAARSGPDLADVAGFGGCSEPTT